jgi:hypothetical protein
MTIIFGLFCVGVFNTDYSIDTDGLISSELSLQTSEIYKIFVYGSLYEIYEIQINEIIKNYVSWVIMPCTPVIVNGHFRGTDCFDLHG